MLPVIVAVAGAGLAGWVLFNNGDELLTAADTLTKVTWGWIALALVSEVVSYWSRGAAQFVVLRSGATHSGASAGDGLGPATLAATTLAGDAAAYCLPFGFAASGVVMVDVLRRRGISLAIAGWLFAVSTVLYVGTVSVLTIVAVQVAGSADPVPGLQTISAVILITLVALGLAYAMLRRGPAARALDLLRAALNRRIAARRDVRDSPALKFERTGSRITVAVRGWVAQLRLVRLSPTAGVAAFALMMVSWLTDIAVLGLAYAALGASPPWAGLLLAYCAGQIAAALPVTPGGLGVVEGSLTLALVAFGGAQTITLAAVLLYRLIAYWGCIPAGGLAWLLLRATAPAQQSPRDQAGDARSRVDPEALEGEAA